MSFDVLLQGKLRGQLTEGTASNGNPFGRFKLGVTDKKGESLLASCITFAPAALAIVAAGLLPVLLLARQLKR